MRIDERVGSLEHRVRALEQHVRNLQSLKAVVAYELSADVTWTRDDLLFRHYINCSSPCAVTLPRLDTGDEVQIRNTGASTLTVKDSAGSTVGTIATGGTSMIGYDGTDTSETEF